MNTETRQLVTIVRKEAREIVTNRILFISGMFFAVWFAAMAALGVGQSGDLAPAVQLQTAP